MRTTFFILTLLLPFLIFSQSTAIPQPTPAAKRIASMEKRKIMCDESPLKNLKADNIGPTVFSGRVSDIEVNPDNPGEFYVAYASGGLWHTTNNGTSFKPIFDRELVMTIGDIAVNWQDGIIWIGTGEVNSSRSSYAGVGIFTSIDTGNTWQYRGLPESHHIGRIILHPENKEEAVVAVLGHLYSSNKERGIYKTSDSGISWEQTLFVSDSTGAVDLIRDPQNPDILYAAIWERSRKAWDFKEAGSESGIYKSVDAGENWVNLITPESGFPTGESVGRIGLDFASDGSIFAIVDNNERKPEEEEAEEKLKAEQIRLMSAEDFLLIDSALLSDFLKENSFPEKYDQDTVMRLIRDKKLEPVDLANFLGDANRELFTRPVSGAEVYRSVNGGANWEKTHEGFLDRVYYSYGYYFGQIRLSRTNSDLMYILGVPILKSSDGGKTWKSVNEENVHVDHHDLWINPKNDDHIILGNDGGINISYDGGENWIKCNSPAVGQFYTVAVDNAEPYRVYGGVQDNGVWMGEHTYNAGSGWHSSGRYPYKSILGGDGMQVSVDSRDNNTVYTGFQFGNYYRINVQKDAYKKIQPQHDLGQLPYRWNWQSPIHLSRHHQDIIYIGSELLHRSMDQGNTFIPLSEDLTMGGKTGDVPYGTLTTIDESAFDFGLIYTGSDDGKLHLSRDGGYSWKEIAEGLPVNFWVSRVRASKHQKARVYCTLNGYRWDNFDALVFVSEDHGAQWHQIATDLPDEPVNVISEDPTDEDILYIGTDHGLYVSFNRGKTTMHSGKEMPCAPVHDLAIQKREKHLLVGTHGRSIYEIDISFFRQMKNAMLDSLLVFLRPDVIKVSYSDQWGEKRVAWQEYQERELSIPFYLPTAGSIELRIVKDKQVYFSKTISGEYGINYLNYDLEADKPKTTKGKKAKEQELIPEPASNGKYYLSAGKYTIEIASQGREALLSLEITSED